MSLKKTTANALQEHSQSPSGVSGIMSILPDTPDETPIPVASIAKARTCPA